MPEKIIIVHPSCIEKRATRFSAPPDERDRATTTLAHIYSILSQASRVIKTDDYPVTDGYRLSQIPRDAPVYLLEHDDTIFIRDFVTPADDVTILGAFRSLCVNWAAAAAIKAQANSVQVSLLGTFE